MFLGGGGGGGVGVWEGGGDIEIVITFDRFNIMVK